MRQRSVLRPARRHVGGEAQKVELVRGGAGVVVVREHGGFETLWLQAGLLEGSVLMIYLLRGCCAWCSVGLRRELIIGADGRGRILSEF
jgi:hypothetical protein